MAEIYIEGIELPKNEPGAFEVIVMYVSADGKIRAECHGTHEVIQLPQHGDLIDRQDLLYSLPAPIEDEYKYTRKVVMAAPAIISAKEDGA